MCLAFGSSLNYAIVRSRVTGMKGCAFAGLTPAQVQLLMNAPAHQVNALAAQLGMMDTSARPGANLGAQAPGLAANQALLQQQKLAAARANFASQQAQQRGAPGAMLGLQAQQPPLLGLQQARQVRTHMRLAGWHSLENSLAA